MGPSGPPLFGDETWNDLGEYLLEPVQEALQNAGVKVATIDVQKGSKVPEQVGSILSEVETFSSCIAHKWGCGGLPIEYEFLNSKIFREKIVSWVGSGGRFIVKGSKLRGGNWPAWFGKYWKFDSYYRTDLECNRSHWCKWYYKAKGSIAFAQAKSVMLRGVAPMDNLFNCCNFEDQCAVAVSKYGEGSVSFFGDVNKEKEICDIMAIIARGK
jgi:hypothetical protein